MQDGETNKLNVATGEPGVIRRGGYSPDEFEGVTLELSGKSGASRYGLNPNIEPPMPFPFRFAREGVIYAIYGR